MTQEDHFGCRRHRPFYDEECSLCIQSDLHYQRTKSSEKHEEKHRQEEPKNERVES